MKTKMLAKFKKLYSKINKKKFSTTIPIKSPEIIANKILKIITLDQFPDSAVIKLP